MNTGRAGPPHLPLEQHGLRPRRIVGAQLLILRLHHRQQMETQGASRFERVQHPLRPERFAGVWGAARPTRLKSAMILSSAAFRMVAFARRSTLTMDLTAGDRGCQSIGGVWRPRERTARVYSLSLELCGSPNGSGGCTERPLSARDTRRGLHAAMRSSRCAWRFYGSHSCSVCCRADWCVP